uniref:Uncharacterized protein n=1 Tax=Rhodnius prolixus TaxID=13249 RepID=T1HG18_RHOPR
MAVTDQLKAIPVSEFEHCYEEWKKRLQRCVASEGSYFEGDNIELRPNLPSGQFPEDNNDAVERSDNFFNDAVINSYIVYKQLGQNMELKHFKEQCAEGQWLYCLQSSALF